MPLVHAFVNPVADDLSVVGTRPSHWNAAHDLSGLNLNELQGDSDDVSEGVTNLYYTPTRFNTAFAAKSTTDLAEGSNLYFTDERAQDAIGAMVDSTIVYVDSTPLLTRAALTGAITAAQGSNATLLGSFTKSQLDTAVSDGNVLYVGDVTQYTDELAQDAVGAMVDASIVYVDGTPLLTRAALTGAITASQGSNSTALGSFTKSQLDGAVSDGNVLYVGDVTQYTDEMAQDAVGGALTDTAEVNFTYNDAGNAITADLIDNSIVVARVHFTATARLLGRSTAAAGAGEEISIGTGLDLTAGVLSATVSSYSDEQAQDAVGGILTDSASIDFTYNDAGNTITATVIQSGITHSSLGGLTTGDAGHTQFALLAGRSGGQALIGGTAASENLTLRATSHATNGTIDFIFEGPVVARREKAAGSHMAGYLRVGSLVDPDNTTAGDLTALRALIGTTEAFTTNYNFEISAVRTYEKGSLTINDSNPAHWYQNTIVTSTAATSPRGAQYHYDFQPTDNIAAAICAVYFAKATPAAAKTITTLIGIDALSVFIGNNGAVTTSYAVFLDTPQATGTLKPTTQIGLSVQDQGLSGITTAIAAQFVVPTNATNKYIFDFPGGNANYIPIRANAVAKKFYTQVPYYSHRFLNYDNGVTYNINSTAYMVPSNGWEVTIDRTLQWTHYRLFMVAQSNQGGQTVTCQLAAAGSTPTTAVHTGGNDLVVTSTVGYFDSGWLTFDDANTDFHQYCFVAKGSNATVDIVVTRAELHVKYDP